MAVAASELDPSDRNTQARTQTLCALINTMIYAYTHSPVISCKLISVDRLVNEMGKARTRCTAAALQLALSGRIRLDLQIPSFTVTAVSLMYPCRISVLWATPPGILPINDMNISCRKEPRKAFPKRQTDSTCSVLPANVQHPSCRRPDLNVPQLDGLGQFLDLLNLAVACRLEPSDLFACFRLLSRRAIKTDGQERMMRMRAQRLGSTRTCVTESSAWVALRLSTHLRRSFSTTSNCCRLRTLEANTGTDPRANESEKGRDMTMACGSRRRGCREVAVVIRKSELLDIDERKGGRTWTGEDDESAGARDSRHDERVRRHRAKSGERAGTSMAWGRRGAAQANRSSLVSALAFSRSFSFSSSRWCSSTISAFFWWAERSQG